jgi:NADPH:quinone reductase-like Zn-dependent oxidoreductase
VRVAAASVNPVDWKVRQGQVRILSGKPPKILGTDLAGTVAPLGFDVPSAPAGVTRALSVAPARSAGVDAERRPRRWQRQVVAFPEPDHPGLSVCTMPWPSSAASPAAARPAAGSSLPCF